MALKLRLSDVWMLTYVAVMVAARAEGAHDTIAKPTNATTQVSRFLILHAPSGGLLYFRKIFPYQVTTLGLRRKQKIPLCPHNFDWSVEGAAGSRRVKIASLGCHG
jgi:hypothetical protein